MHIAEVSQYYYPYHGGQETYVRQLSRHFASRGHRVTVITTTPHEGQNDGPLEIRSHHSFFSPLNNPLSSAVFEESKLLRNCDIVHAHNEHSFLTLSVAALRSRRPIPFVLTTHGQLRFGSPGRDLFRRLYSSTVGNFVLRKADRVFVNSPEDARAARFRGVADWKIVETSNAIDPHYLRGFQTPRARTKLAIPPEAKIILYVGRLIERKGIRTLLRAFQECLIFRSDLMLVLVGEGPLAAMCRMVSERAPAAGRILLLSNVPDEILYLYYQAADLFVLPSLSEVCPTVVLEALFFGCRVIASDIPGIRDHFANFARLVRGGNPHALAGSILELCDTPRNGVPRSSSAFVGRKYDWTHVAETYLSTFAELDSAPSSIV